MNTPSARPPAPEIVAHRGDAEHFPENTLPALAAAWRLGLRWVECDVQLSADRVPYLLHDADLARTTACAGDVRLMSSGRLDGIEAGEPARFGARHAGTRLPRLEALAALMAEHPDVRAFVEIKRASLAHHGHAACIDRVLASLGEAASRCVAISFDAEACRLARSAGGLPVGWVLDRPPAAAAEDLRELAPEYAFCDHRRMPRGEALPPGDWRWVVYEVEDAATARALQAMGVQMVETMAPSRLLRELGGGAAPA